MPKSTVARIETQPAANPQWETVQRLVRAAGGVLVVTSAETAPAPASASASVPRPVPPLEDDEVRDEAGRRYPAHLDVRKVRTLRDWPGAWWAHWYTLPPDRWPLRVPDLTYDLDRRRRDDERLRKWLPDAVTVRRDRAELPETSWRLVAELPDGRPVGELRAHEQSGDLALGFDLGDVRSVVLDGVVVAPRLRGMGIGRRLVGQLAEEMRQAGVTTAKAVAQGDGVGFLRACGYRAVADDRPMVLRYDGRGPLRRRAR